MNYASLHACPSRTVGTLETIGYAEEHAAQRVATFLAQPHTALVDIRFTPRCRWCAAWNKAALLEKYGPRQYIHVKALGNVNYRKPGEPMQLLDPGEAVGKTVATLQRGVSLLLMCACKDYQRCHRKMVYELIRVALAVAEQQQEVEMNRPRLELCSSRNVMQGQLPDGRILCVHVQTFIDALSEMPSDYLDDPNNWLPCVNGKTCWIDNQGVQA